MNFRTFLIATTLTTMSINSVRHLCPKVKHATWRWWGLPLIATQLSSLTTITLTPSFISDIIHSCPLLHPHPPPRNRWRKAICLMFLWACEAADRFDAAGDSYLSAVSTPLLFSLCLCLLLPPSPPLKANLVAAFEQSLALMTARLQTLSVSSDQKVSRWYHDVNECCTISDMTKKQTIKEQLKGRNMWWWWW